ncbi:iron-sulfur cluster repair protein YtfE [Solimonas variicoloris]|uniref:iron-sulfur cluster repair protein YtfE n=1 Tax=Solimonas variicoloris TaxID=254408 RepID=UPI00037264EE|nr:iron-sulfur cluster repair protein YtfE [Solimonas variicoloris]
MTISEPAPATTEALAQRTLGDIASQLPGATAVFRKYKLDFCCGGNVALREAAARKSLPLDALAAELRAIDPAGYAVPPDATEPLIAHIVQRYHQVHRRELPELVRLATRVEAVHRQHPEAPLGLADALKEMALELEAHMQKEEAVLFPMMSAGTAMLGQPIAVMRHEHDEHGERLRHIEALTHQTELPADACPTWRALYVGVRKLIDDLMEHIHLENNVLFPRFATTAPTH